MATPTDCAYAAALIDCDGWITVGVSNGVRKSGVTPGKTWGHWFVRCALKQADREAVEWMHVTFGGNINTIKPRHQPRAVIQPKNTMYVWSIAGPSLPVFLKQIQPFLKIKVGPARAAIEFYEGWQHLQRCLDPVAERARRHVIYDTIRSFNQRFKKAG